MGGILSGCNGYRGGRPPVEAFPHASLTYRSQFDLRRRETYVRIESDESAVLVHGPLEWPVTIATTPLHYGGHRRWLVCPRCKIKRQALYIDKNTPTCRVCLGARYSSQHDNRRDRLYRRANAIRKRLGWPPGIARPPGEKPGRMHWQTFKRLQDELDQLTAALTINVEKWVGRAEIRLDRLGAKHARLHPSNCLAQAKISS